MQKYSNKVKRYDKLEKIYASDLDKEVIVPMYKQLLQISN